MSLPSHPSLAVQDPLRAFLSNKTSHVLAIKWMSWVWENGPNTPELRFTLLKLADNADDDGVCWPKVGDIARKTCQSERTIQRHLKHLSDEGWIERDAIVGGRGKAATMRLLKPKGRQNDTLSETQTVTPVTPIPEIKGDTYDAERVTPMTQKGDTGDVSPTPPIRKNRQEPPLETSKAAFTLPDWIPSDLWADYLKMRKKIGKPATERAKFLAVSALDKFRNQGHGAAAVLEQSIMNSWQGLFEIKQPKENGHNGKLSNIERNAPSTREVISRLREAGSNHTGVDGTLGMFPATGDTRPAHTNALPRSAGEPASSQLGPGVQPGATGTVAILPHAGRTPQASRMPDRRPTF